MRRASLFCIVVFVLSQCTAVMGSITWAARELWLPAAEGVEKLEGSFAFTNEGTYAVAIGSVSSSCGCTVPTVEKKVYQPGEGGAIHVTFTVGDRAGPQQKTVTVRCDDPAEPVITLAIKTDIPRTFEASQRYVFWKTGDEPVAREVTIRWDGAQPAVLHIMPATGEHVHTSLKEVLPGREYVLSVRPESVREAFTQVIEVKPDLPGNARSLRIYAAVRAPATTAASADTRASRADERSVVEPSSSGLTGEH